jgi:hypothetical protein
LLAELNRALAEEDHVGELYLVGGAVMTLVFRARAATRDLDGFFQPTSVVRKAAARVAVAHGLDAGWLNDAAKGYLSQSGTFAPFLDLGNLRVLTAQPEYLLAMKCLSMRLGPEFFDESDARYLLRHLNIETAAAAMDVIARYYPRQAFPHKTLYALEEILGA